MPDPVLDAIQGQQIQQDQQKQSGDPILNAIKGQPNSAVESKLHAAQTIGQSTSPDDAAKAIEASKQNGLPVDVNQRNPDFAKPLPPDAGGIVKNAPALADYMSQSPEHASALSNDVDSYVQFEKNASTFDKVNDVAKRVSNTVTDLLGGAALFAKDITHDPGEQKHLQMAADFFKNQHLPTESDKQDWEHIVYMYNKGDKDAATWAVFGHIASFVPQALGMAVPGGMEAEIASGIGSAKDEALKEGKTEGQANASAWISGIGSEILGRTVDVPVVKGMFSHLVGKVGKSATYEIAKNAAMNVLKSSGLMGASSVAQEAIDTFARSVSGDKDAWNGFWERAKDQGLGGAVLGAFTGGFHELHEHKEIMDKVGAERDLNKSEINGQLWSELNKSSDASKLSQTSPMLHKDALSAVLKNKDAETAYMSAGGLKAYAESIGVTPEKAADELGVLDQYKDKVVSGGDIRMSTADLISRVAGTDHAQKFKDIIRFHPTDNTIEEAKQNKEDIYNLYKPQETEQKPTIIDKTKEVINGVMDKLGFKPKEEPEVKSIVSQPVSKPVNKMPKPIPDNATWPTSIAKDTLEKLNPPLPLATDELTKMGFSPKDAETYLRSVNDMVDKAKDVVSDSEIKNWRKEWAEKKAELRPEISKSYYLQRSIIAENELNMYNKRFNKSNYDGYEQSVKDNIVSLEKYAHHGVDSGYHPEFEHILDSKPSFSEFAGYVAEKAGYGSVDEMLKDIHPGTDHEAVVDKLAEQQTEESMGDRRKEIEEEIRDRILDYKMDRVLKKSADLMMAKRPGQERAFVKKLISPAKDELSKERSTADLLQTPVDSLSSEAAFKQMQKAMKESGELWAKGDRDGAMDANARARYALQLRTKMRMAEKEMLKLVSTAKKIGKQSFRNKIISVGDDHLAQLDRLVKMYGLPGKAANAQKPDYGIQQYFDKFVNGYGNDIQVPSNIQNGQDPTDYKKTPYGEVQDVHNLIKAIIKEATEGHEVVVDGIKRTIEEFRGIVKESKDKNFPNASSEDFGMSDFQKLINAVPSGAKAIYNYHAIASYLLDKIGGPSPLNPVYKFVHSGMVENSQIKYSELMRNQVEFEKNLRKELGISDDEYDGWSLGSSYYPSLDNKNIPDAKFKHGGNMTPDKLISTLFNCGSESNLRGLSAHGWTEDTLREAFEGNKRTASLGPFERVTLGISKKQADYVKAHLKRLSGYYYEMANEVSQRTNGFKPGMIEGKPFTFKTNDGHEVTIEGYFPTKNQNYHESVQDKTGPIGKQFEGKYSTPKTNQDHLRARTGEGTHAPDLNLRVLNEYMRASIHDSAYRETIIGLNRIFGDEQTRKMITDMTGKGTMKVIDSWIKDMAVKSTTTGDDFYERHVLPLMSNLVAGALGWNLNPVLEHLTSLSNASYDVGPRIIPAAIKMGPDLAIESAKKIKDGLDYVFPKHITKNVSDAFENVGDNRCIDTLNRWCGHLPSMSNDFNFISNSDPYMIDELKRGFGEFEMDETVSGQKSYIMKMFNHGSFGASAAFVKTGFMALRMMDMLNKAAIWKSTYDRAITGGYKDIQAGDHESSVLLARKNVKQLKGSQYAEDLPQVLKSKTMRPFNTFMRPFILGLNQSVRAVGGFKTAQDYILKGAALTVVMSLIPTLWQQKVKKEHIPNLIGTGWKSGWEYELQRMAVYQSQSVVGLRSLATLYEQREMEGRHGIDMDIMPTQRIATETAVGLGDLIHGTTHGNANEALSDKSTDALGYCLGFGTPHMMKFMDKYLK